MPPTDSEEVRTADFSEDRIYRYTLWRVWDNWQAEQDELRYVMFIGLNPSTADERVDDQTIRRCRYFAQQWGYEGMCMTNLFAVRATDPTKMRAHPAPIGPENDEWLQQVLLDADLKVACWGSQGGFMDRDMQIALWIRDLYCFGTTKNGDPKHPVRLANTTQLVPL